jgi:hypothetical protein
MQVAFDVGLAKYSIPNCQVDVQLNGCKLTASGDELLTDFTSNLLILDKKRSSP